MPYSLSHGIFVWPFAYDTKEDDLTSFERRLLGTLPADAPFVNGNYFGWRAGVNARGDRIFYVAGD